MKYYPLSYQQQKLYVYSKFHNNDSEYNLIEGIELLDNYDKELLETIVYRIIDEEPILRCRIVEHECNPVQYVSNVEDFRINYVTVEKEKLDEKIEQIAKEPFELIDADLFKVYVLSSVDGRIIVIFKFHHIISDGWSLQLLMEKFCKYYFEDGESEGTDSSLRYTYYDYCEEQEGARKTEKYLERQKYWLDTLNCYTSEIAMPVGNKIEDIDREGCRIRFKSDLGQSKQINDYCSDLKITPFAFLASVYGDLMARFCREKKICIAVPVANRFSKKIMGITGYFVNTIPLAFDFSEKKTVVDRIKQQHIDFTRMIAKSDVDIECKCNVMFVFQSRPKVSNNLAEKVSLLRLENKKSKYDISLSITYENGEYVFEWEYLKKNFEEKFIRNLNAYYTNLIDEYISKPNVVTSKLSLLNSEQIIKQKEGWNNTEKKYDAPDNLIEIMDEAVRLYSNETALIYENQHVSYAEFSNYTNALANELKKLGVKQGDIVPIMFNRSIEMVVAIHAVIKLGCAYFPLDTHAPQERLKYMIENSGSKIVLTSDSLSGKLEGVARYYVVDIACLNNPSDYISAKVNGNDRAYVIYTSGSTGNPKGVVNVHEGIVNRLNWMQEMFPLAPGKKVLQKTPYTFDVSVWELIWPLLKGATLVIAKPEGHKDPEYIANLIIKEQINVIHFVPSMLKKFLSTDICRYCESLEYVIASGEKLEAPTCVDFYKKMKATLANLYGPTEAAIDVSCEIVNKDEIGSVIPIGRPIANIHLYKLNDELMFDPIEIPGELFISGIGLAEGYLNNELETNKAFLKCPWNDSFPYNRIYKTGDIVRLTDDGNIIYLDRKDSQVKIRGQRIELSEIENHILEVDGVDAAVVMVRVSDDGQQVLYGFVKSKTCDENIINKHLSNYLMEYMIPKVYCFLDEMPVNANGKADRKKLATIPIETEEKSYIAPEDIYEKVVAESIATVLGIKRVSRDADFYELGGTSLSIYDVKLSVEKNLGYKIPFDLFIGDSRVCDLAAAIRCHMSSNDTASTKQIVIDDEVKEFKNLPTDIRANNDELSTVFITGATGFLGSYLLQEYIESSAVKRIICLVRSSNSLEGKERIKNNMLKWGVWNDDYSSRFEVFSGDLTEENLGLSQTQLQYLQDNVDIICHNGANVNFSLSYEQIAKTNVEGTKNVLKILDKGKRKRFSYISTISIFSEKDYRNGIVYEDVLPQDVNSLRLGYAKSKCVVEYILREYMKQNYDVKVFRIGRITGTINQQTENEDMFYKMAYFCKKMGIYPDIRMNLNCIPVDSVSKMIVYASLKDMNTGTYHLVNPDVNNEISLSEIFDEYDMDKVMWETWYERCEARAKENDDLARQISVMLKEQLGTIGVSIDMKNAKRLISESKTEIPNVQNIIKNMICAM